MITSTRGLSDPCFVMMLLALLLAPMVASAQGFSGLARLDVSQSQVRDAGDGIAVTLYLSQAVPWRVFTLDDPRRLVVDFREVDWRGATRAGLLNADNATDLRFGTLRPGWSRLVVDLAGPMTVAEAGMRVDAADGTAVVRVVLQAAPEGAFAAASGAPSDPDWDALMALDTTVPPPPGPDGPLVVVIDPGHGGIDPGAERGGMVEAQVNLQLAQELAEALSRIDGIRAVLTRTGDVFVPLGQRMTVARAAGADLMLSLHADALDDTTTRGASVYTLTEDALDDASARMAERHDRGDLLSGLDLSGQDDTVATVLMDMARRETAPQADTLASAIVQGLRDNRARVNGTPRRQARLAVLNAADFPSVLVEVGFLSNAGDREALASPEGRALIVQGLVQAILRWQADREAHAPLIRQ